MGQDEEAGHGDHPTVLLPGSENHDDPGHSGDACADDPPIPEIGGGELIEDGLTASRV
jgi:hypothetical protein